jgi:hypothetical protein
LDIKRTLDRRQEELQVGSERRRPDVWHDRYPKGIDILRHERDIHTFDVYFIADHDDISLVLAELR